MLSFDNGKITSSSIESFQIIDSPPEIIKLELEDGQDIKVTKDHELLHVGKRAVMREAGALKEGDYLVRRIKKEGIDREHNGFLKAQKIISNQYTTNNTRPEVEPVRITKISIIPSAGKVYDLTIKNTHNFLIGKSGVVSSNCHDFGEMIKTGAHMAELRRTRAGPFTENMSVTMQQLTDAYRIAKKGDEKTFREIFMPAEKLVDYMPAVVVLDSAVHSITQGASLKVPGVVAYSDNIKKGCVVRVLTQKGELIATGVSRIDADMPQKGVVVSPKKVFMSPEVYPRME